MILIYFDDRYYENAPIYIKSIEVNEPNEKVFIQGYNLSDKMMAKLKAYENVVAVNNEDLTRSKARMDRLEHYIINQKAKQMLEAFDRFPEEDLFIITDVDMLMVNPLTDLKEDMKTYDVGVVWVDEDKIMGGFVAVRRSKRTREFLEMWGGIMTKGRYFYNKDQPALAKTFKSYYKKLDFLLLSRQYVDQASNNSSYIWSAHKCMRYGSKRQKRSQYNTKLKKMLRR
jgi:hypothetical protein